MANVHITGGGALLRNFPERLQQELETVSRGRTRARARVTSNARRCTMEPWIGASIVARLPTFDTLWMSKEEYEEFGVSLAHRRCL